MQCLYTSQGEYICKKSSTAYGRSILEGFTSATPAPPPANNAQPTLSNTTAANQDELKKVMGQLVASCYVSDNNNANLQVISSLNGTAGTQCKNAIVNTVNNVCGERTSCLLSPPANSRIARCVESSYGFDNIRTNLANKLNNLTNDANSIVQVNPQLSSTSRLVNIPNPTQLNDTLYPILKEFKCPNK